HAEKAECLVPQGIRDFVPCSGMAGQNDFVPRTRADGTKCLTHARRRSPVEGAEREEAHMPHTPRPPVGARPVPPRTPGGLFRPRPRGDLAKALSSRRAMEVVAPESPRPSEMMEGVTVNGEDVLTADDAALHELLISHAYAEDCSMPEAMHEIEMAAAIRYLGGRVERSDVRRSLERLKNTAVSFGTPETRRYEDVRLLEGYVEVGPERDVIHYRLPEPLRVLMSE